MKVLLVSQSFVLVESLEGLFLNLFKDSTVKLRSNLNKISVNDLIEQDLLFLHTEFKLDDEISIINEAKRKSDNLKVIVLDNKNNKENLRNLVKIGVDGYITSISQKEEFIFLINKVLQGKKIYETDVIPNSSQNNNLLNSCILTKREKEVLIEIGKGISNKEISENLFISEATAKKHVSSILEKLSLKNRQEAILLISKATF